MLLVKLRPAAPVNVSSKTTDPGGACRDVVGDPQRRDYVQAPRRLEITQRLQTHPFVLGHQVGGGSAERKR